MTSIDIEYTNEGNAVICFGAIECLFVFGGTALPPPSVVQGLLIHEVYRSHTTTHHRRQDSSGRVISWSQRPLLDNTQQSQQTDIHASCGIRTHSLSRRAAADPRLRPRGHWDRQLLLIMNQNVFVFKRVAK